MAATGKRLRSEAKSISALLSKTETQGMCGLEFRAATPRRLQIPPLRSCGAPVGMTRGGQVLSEKMATRMDGVKSGYSAKTADPSTTLLRSSGLGMTRGGQVLSETMATRMDGVKSGYS